jgi:macrolide transport system ATP-binding/permease protein
MNPATPARTKAQLSALDVDVIRDGRVILNDISLTVTPGTKVGVVGENGRGKTTLIRVLAGEIDPDAGGISRIGSVGVAEQELNPLGERTVGDLIDVELSVIRAALARLDHAANALVHATAEADAEYAQALALATRLDAWDADRRVDIGLLALGAVTDRRRRLETMSVGERYRVRLACLLGASHDFLLLDEPTNHLDANGLNFLTAALQATNAGIVLVSHDRALLRDVATTILDLDPTPDGRARLYGDGYGGYIRGRSSEKARWVQAYQEFQAEHTRLEGDLAEAQERLKSAWRPPKGTGKHQRATRAPAHVRSVHHRIELLEAHEVTRPPEPLVFTFPRLPELPEHTLLQAHEVTVEGRLIVPTSTALASGDRLLITGPNGAGKSTLLAVFAGDLNPTTGSVQWAPQARIGLVGQESLWSERRTPRELFNSRITSVLDNEPRQEPIVELGSLGLLPEADLARPITDLSIGQQRRLDLALALAGRPNVLLLDEPTNHLSVTLVDELTEALDATPAAVVVVTHDRQLRRDLEHWPEIVIKTSRT